MNDSAQDLEQLIHQYTQELLRFQKQYAAQMASTEEESPAVPAAAPADAPIPSASEILDDPILSDETSMPTVAVLQRQDPSMILEKEEEASPLPPMDETTCEDSYEEPDVPGDRPLLLADPDGRHPRRMQHNRASGITQEELEAPYMRSAALEGETNGIGTGENAARDDAPMGADNFEAYIPDMDLVGTDAGEARVIENARMGFGNVETPLSDTEPTRTEDGEFTDMDGRPMDQPGTDMDNAPAPAEDRDLMSDPDAGVQEAFPPAPGAGEGTGGPELTDFGRLQVQVFKAREAIPIENATVTIFLEEDDEPTPITVTKTNRSGFTPAITVPTVSATLSLEPGHEHPYASYLVQVIAPGYFTVEDIHVPVYGGITSVQPVEMLPLPENFQGDPNVTYPEDGPNL